MPHEEYAYRAILESPHCGVKRAVAFSTAGYLDWWEAGKEAYKHMFSQTCVRCGANHTSEEFVLIELTCGEPSPNGTVYFRVVLPPRYEDTGIQPELPLEVSA